MNQKQRLLNFIMIITVILLSFFSIVNSRSERICDDNHQLIKLVDDYSGGDSADHLNLKYTIPMNAKTRNSLFFYSAHSEVNVYIDQELVYALYSDDDSIIKTPGYNWHMIPMDESYRGKTLEIDIRNVYGHNVQSIDLYEGSQLGLLDYLKNQSLLSTTISVALIAISLILMIYQHANKRYVNDTFKYLALFTLTMGLWRLFDTISNSSLASDTTHIYIGLYGTFLVLPSLFTLFIANRYQILDSKLIKWFYAFNYFTILLQLIFQLLNILDFKEMIIVSHLNIGISISIAIYYSLRNMSSTTQRNNIDSFALFTFLFLCFVDLLYYFSFKENGVLSSFAFIIYLLIVSYDLVKVSQQNINKVKEVELYRKLAYIDELTGISNRAAYQRDLDNFSTQLSYSTKSFDEKFGVIIVDLNNLKQCNDTLGHAYGDDYIKAISNLLTTTFDNGKHCYRIGGDEFAVFVPNSNSLDLSMKVTNLNANILNASKDYDDIDLSVALGHALFDLSSDHELLDTIERADKRMYEIKSYMKNR